MRYIILLIILLLNYYIDFIQSYSLEWVGDSTIRGLYDVVCRTDHLHMPRMPTIECNYESNHFFVQYKPIIPTGGFSRYKGDICLFTTCAHFTQWNLYKANYPKQKAESNRLNCNHTAYSQAVDIIYNKIKQQSRCKLLYHVDCMYRPDGLFSEMNGCKNRPYSEVYVSKPYTLNIFHQYYDILNQLGPDFYYDGRIHIYNNKHNYENTTISIIGNILYEMLAYNVFKDLNQFIKLKLIDNIPDDELNYYNNKKYNKYWYIGEKKS